MGKSALFLAAAALLLPIIRPGEARAQQPSRATSPAAVDASNRVTGYSAWDDDFFYIAVQVNKPTVQAKNTEPFSHPLEDDAVILSLQTDNDHRAVKRTTNTVNFVVSAGNGFQLYTGPEAAPLFNSLQDFNDRLKDIVQNEKDPVVQQKKLLDLQNRVVKVKVSAQGGERPGGGRSPGYTVELAIPWADLGGKPAPGAKMGISLIAQSKAAGSPQIQSLSPNVKGISDIENPSLWSTVSFSNSPSPSTLASLISPRVFVARPVIDGDVANGEWNGLSQFSFGETPGNLASVVSLEKTRQSRSHLELITHPARPAVPILAASTEPLPMKPHVAQKLPALVMAKYEYWYQADARKAAPALHVFHANQSSALAHHPLEGSGPWFTYDRVDWHRKQLTDARQAGVDVILPVYRGAARDRQLYADKGLTVLASALQSLRQAGQDYPQVGLFLDTNALIQITGDRADLRIPTTQAALYGVIRDFYRRVPTEFRCVIPLSAENGGHSAYPVFLSDAGAFKELDSSFVPYVRGRFLREFGADLVLIGGSNFQPKATLDGYFTSTAGQNMHLDTGGWMKLATVGIGLDSALQEELPQTPSRRSEDRYRAGWTAAVAQHPDLILLNDWNNFEQGSEIAPSLEAGLGASDLTRVYTRAFAGPTRFNSKFLWHDIPETMPAGSTYQVRVRLQNTGLAGWGATEGMPTVVQYRWRRGGQIVAESGTKQGIAIDSLPAGQNRELALSIKTAGSNGAALPAGDYTLEIAPVELNKKETDADIQSRALNVPVHIGGSLSTQPQWAGSVVKSDVPFMMESGSGYLADAILRNDGAQTWRKADGVRISLRLYRMGDGADKSTQEEQLVTTADASIPLAQDVAPGQETPVHLLLPLIDSTGKPIPLWTQDDLWSYVLRWEVAPEGQTGVRPAAAQSDSRTDAGATFGATPLVVSDFDFGVRFTVDKTPSSLPADRKQPITLSLQNTGPQTWKRDEVRVGYHWYYLDGTELRWEDVQTPLAQDVPPGGRINDLLADVTAPTTDGTYFLVWDVKFGDMWASTSAVSRHFDTVVHTVTVIGGHLIFTDLTKAFNLDGSSDSDHLAGDFDGNGRSFPAELLPPYTDTPVVPAAMFLPVVDAGPESARRISFRWGPKEGKAPNYIVCKGQRVDLGKSSGQCRVLHIVAAATEKDMQETMKLVFEEPDGQSEDQYAFSVSRWDVPPTHGDEVALLARRHYEKDGLKPGAIALYHYTIKIREPRKLIALLLPNAPQIKIAAITLEK